MDSAEQKYTNGKGHVLQDEEAKDLNPFENGITSLSSDTFQFGNDDKESNPSAATAQSSAGEQALNPLFSTDSACEVLDIDDIHRTVAVQFDPEELDRAVEFERIKEEVERRSRLAQAKSDGNETASHIGEITVRRHDARLLNVKINKPKKKLHSLFGAKVTCLCQCEVYDEVRVAVWILAFLAAATVGILFIVDLSTSVSDLVATDIQKHSMALSIAAPFVVIASVMSFFQIRKHLQNWVHPASQKCVIRILAMVPIYAISAYMGLLLYKSTMALYIDFVRQCYEAYVIYQFMVLLTQYLGGPSGVVESIQYKPPLNWPSPLCCCSQVIPGAKFLRGLKYGALQYTFLAPACGIIIIISNQQNIYDNGTWSIYDVYPYTTLLINFSQMASLYSLVWLYVVLKNELAPFNPMYKFLVVKSVVFFTWWQGVGIAFLASMGWINKDADFQSGLQDFIVCIEMFLAAAAHRYTFGYETYANGSMTLLMEQRAQRLAELNYKKAVEEQQKRLKDLGIIEGSSLSSHLLQGLTQSHSSDPQSVRKFLAVAEEQVEDGTVLFDEDKPVPENVVAPVILQAMKAEKEQQRKQRYGNEDAQIAYSNLSSSTNGKGRINSGHELGKVDLRTADDSNPFERI